MRGGCSRASEPYERRTRNRAAIPIHNPLLEKQKKMLTKSLRGRSPRSRKKQSKAERTRVNHPLCLTEQIRLAFATTHALPPRRGSARERVDRKSFEKGSRS